MKVEALGFDLLPYDPANYPSKDYVILCLYSTLIDALTAFGSRSRAISRYLARELP